MTRKEAKVGLLVRMLVDLQGRKVERFGIITQVGTEWVCVDWENDVKGVLYWEPAHAANAFRLEVQPR